jgi:hypothetical protein
MEARAYPGGDSMRMCRRTAAQWSALMADGRRRSLVTGVVVL